MKRKERIFILVGVVLTVLISAGFYVNYQLDHLVASLNRPGVLFVDREDPSGDINVGEPGDTSGTVVGPTYTPLPGTAHTPDSAVDPLKPGPDQSDNGSSASANSDIANDVLAKVDKPVDKADLVKAGLIILRKLNSDEISFLYGVGNKDHYTTEELKRAREILLNKLSAEDVQTLRKLGAKYGKPLHVLDERYEIK